MKENFFFKINQKNVFLFIYLVLSMILLFSGFLPAKLEYSNNFDSLLKGNQATSVKESYFFSSLSFINEVGGDLDYPMLIILFFSLLVPTAFFTGFLPLKKTYILSHRMVYLYCFLLSIFMAIIFYFSTPDLARNMTGFIFFILFPFSAFTIVSHLLLPNFYPLFFLKHLLYIPFFLYAFSGFSHWYLYLYDLQIQTYTVYSQLFFSQHYILIPYVILILTSIVRKDGKDFFEMILSK